MPPDDEPDPTITLIPWRSTALYVILSASLVGIMGVSLISPVLPDLRPVFGVTDSQVGLVITMYTLPGIFLTPLVGLLADRFGRRRVIVPLLLIFGIAGAAITFADRFAVVLALRFVQGIGASALVALAVTLIGDLYTGARRNAVVGLNGSAIGIGAAIFPVIGGWLAGVRWNAPFLFFGVAVVVGVVTAVLLEEPDSGRATNVRAYLDGLREVIVLPEALAIFGALIAALFIFYGAVLTALPLLLSDAFGLRAAEIGPLIGMSALASAFVASQYGRISQWQSAPELLALGFVAYGIGLFGIWVAPSPLLVGVSLLAFGVGFGIVMPSIDTTLITLVTGRLRAGMMGLRTSMLRIGQTLGPFGFTYGAENAFASSIVGYRTLLLLAGIVVTIAGGLAYWHVRG